MVDIYQIIEDVKESIVLFRPVYTREGNISELYFLMEGQLQQAYDQRLLLTVRQALARSYNLDLSAQSKELEKMLDRKFPLPFYLPDGRVFVPLKMRKPLVLRDSSYGYVDINYIKSVRKASGQVILTLISEDEIPLCSSSASAYQSIEMGRVIAEYIDRKANSEQEKVLDALGILIDKLYRIEKILEKY